MSSDVLLLSSQSPKAAFGRHYPAAPPVEPNGAWAASNGVLEGVKACSVGSGLSTGLAYGAARVMLAPAA